MGNASMPQKILPSTSNAGTPKTFLEIASSVLFFSNAFAFVNHIRALSAFKNENTIRLNISSCLRGEALEWFISELSQCEREKLRSSSLEEGWIESLINRFKTRPSHALKALKKSRYNWADVRCQRSLVMWAHNMLRLAQESNEYPAVWQQVHAQLGIEEWNLFHQSLRLQCVGGNDHQRRMVRGVLRQGQGVRRPT